MLLLDKCFQRKMSFQEQTSMLLPRQTLFKMKRWQENNFWRQPNTNHNTFDAPKKHV